MRDVEALVSHVEKVPDAWRKAAGGACSALHDAIVHVRSAGVIPKVHIKTPNPSDVYTHMHCPASTMDGWPRYLNHDLCGAAIIRDPGFHAEI